MGMFHYNISELLALLIKGMLEKNPYDRITLQEISNGSQAILPMKLTYLNIKEKMKKIRLRVKYLYLFIDKCFWNQRIRRFRQII